MLFIPPFIPPPVYETTNLFIASIVLPFPKWKKTIWKGYTTFKHKMCSIFPPTNMHLRLLHIFSWQFFVFSNYLY